MRARERVFLEALPAMNAVTGYLISSPEISGFLLYQHLIQTIPMLRNRVVVFWAHIVRRLAYPAAGYIRVVTRGAVRIAPPSTVPSSRRRGPSVCNWDCLVMGVRFLRRCFSGLTRD